MRPYAQYRSDGALWRAGRTIFGLCAAWNHATDPSCPMTDAEHRRRHTYARAIKARMARMGYRYGVHYLHLPGGALWPVRA